MLFPAPGDKVAYRMAGGGAAVTYAQLEAESNRAARLFRHHGLKPGDGIAILMNNCVEYLYLFYGMPRGGFYSVPINVALKGDGLRYILTHSDVKYLVVDDTLHRRFAELESPVGAIEKVFVRKTKEDPLPKGAIPLDELLKGSPKKPSLTPDPEAVTFLMYTSGTTGFPKGVVNRNRSANIEGFKLLTSLVYKPDDVLYTCPICMA